jgi:hypothetical protein
MRLKISVFMVYAVLKNVHEKVALMKAFPCRRAGEEI